MRPPNIGKCIYCGSLEDLTTEHIIPYGFNGQRVLLKASCRKCAAITSSFERKILRDSWGNLRAIFGIKSRNKRSQSLPMKMVINGRIVVQEVPLEFYIPLLPVIYAAFPTYLQNKQRHRKGKDKRKVTIETRMIYKWGFQIDALLGKYKATKLLLNSNIEPYEFGRLLAKIAYCFAVEKFGLNNIADNYVLPAILNQSNDVWHFVGCDKNYPHINSKPNKKSAFIWGDMDVFEGDIIVRLRLLPHHNLPVYIVVVGKASDGLQMLIEGLKKH